MSIPSLSRFTPSLLSGEVLEAMFVQREQLASNLLERIRSSATTPSKHYSLVIGPRGIGKTHLVSLVHHRIQSDEELAGQLICAWLREEEWGITSFVDLLIRVLRTLANELGDNELDQKYQQMFDLDIDAAELAAEKLLLEVVADRTLLVIVENLDEVFGGLRVEGQAKLRSYLQNNPKWTILATSQSLFRGVSLRSSPFYGFFETSHLRELAFDDAVELLRKIAVLQENVQLALDLQTTIGRSRVRAIHHLAAGNPRVYVILSQFLTSSSLDQLVEPLMRTLDDLTPYYQARMTYLSAQQRKLVEFLCERRSAVAVKEIAKRNFVTPQTASSQLNKLTEMGYVRPVRIGRESFYELREPLMRLSMEVKRQRGAPLRLFVEFLRLWFSRQELLDRLNHLDESASVDKQYLAEAAEEQGSETLLALEQAIALTAESSEIWHQCGISYYRLGRLEESLGALDRALALDSKNRYLVSNRAVALSSLGRHDQALAAFDSAMEDSELGDSFHCVSNRAATLMFLGRWQDGLGVLDAALEGASEVDLKEDSGEIAIVRNLLIWTQREAAWRRQVEAYIEVFSRHGRLTLLGQGLVRTIRTLSIPWITEEMVSTWNGVWQEFGTGRPELAISLRLFEVAVQYRAHGDPRVLLTLPAEERALLEPLLEAPLSSQMAAKELASVVLA